MNEPRISKEIVFSTHNLYNLVSIIAARYGVQQRMPASSRETTILLIDSLKST